MELNPPAPTGNGYPTWKFNEIGSKIAGTVTSDPIVKSLPNLDRNKPNEDHLIFELHSDETLVCTNQKGDKFEGQDWSIFIKINSQPYRALFDAVKQNGPDARFEKGDRFAQQLTGKEDIGKPSPMNVFAVAVKKGERPTPSFEAKSVADLL